MHQSSCPQVLYFKLYTPGLTIAMFFSMLYNAKFKFSGVTLSFTLPHRTGHGLNIMIIVKTTQFHYLKNLFKPIQTPQLMKLKLISRITLPYLNE